MRVVNVQPWFTENTCLRQDIDKIFCKKLCCSASTMLYQVSYGASLLHLKSDALSWLCDANIKNVFIYKQCTMVKRFQGSKFCARNSAKTSLFYFFIGNLLTIICVQRNQSCCHFTVHVTKLRPLWSHKLPKFYLWDIKMYLGAFVRVKIIVLQPFFCIHS